MSGSENEEGESSENFDTPGIIPQNGKRKASAIRGRATKARKWSDVEVDQLVDLLEERICLWDVFSKDYHLRDKKERAYLEMAEKLGIAVVDIKAKIIGLRAQLGREIAKSKSTKSGQAVTDSYKSNWIYWEKLQFLAAVMQAGKSKDNMPPRTITSPQHGSDESLASLQDQPAESLYDGDENSPLVTKQRTAPPKTARKCDTELKKQELLSTCIQVLREPIMPPPQARESAFSIYIAEKLSQFDRRTRTIAEKRISDIIFDLEMNDQSAQFQPIMHQYQHHQASEASVPSGDFMGMLGSSQYRF